MKRLFLFAALFIVSIITLNAQEVTNKGKFSGYMFGDVFYNAARDTGITSLSNVANGGKKDVNGVQLRRIYFAYSYDISSKFTSLFRLEADQTLNSNTAGGKIGVMVKDASLTWKNIFEGSDLIFGLQSTPAFDISESFWGHRFLEKTIMDLRGIVPSRDLAIALKGKLSISGDFKYWVMLGDGSGNAPEADKYKRYYVNLQYLPSKNFTVTAYADLKSKAAINDPNSLSKPPATLSNNELTYALFVGYDEKENFGLGAEGFMRTTQNGLIKGTVVNDLTGLGFTLYGSYYFSKEVSTTARYDYYDPNTNSNYKGDSRNYFIFALNYQPDPNITISPNVLIETYESAQGGPFYDASITPRLTFFYKFF